MIYGIYSTRMITQDKLNTGLPPISYNEDGSVNCVLALVNVNTYYCKSNTYIPPWQISNTIWYNNHPEQYVGWIALEHVKLPDEKDLPETDWEAEDAFLNKLFGVDETV